MNQPKGSAHYCAKLIESDVKLVRFLLKDDATYKHMKQVAALLNVSYNCIYDILKGRTWKHVS